MLNHVDIPPELITQAVRDMLPSQRILSIERATEGVSTVVYRIRSSEATSYLRICPELGVSLAAEAAVYRLLSEQHTPQVLFAASPHPLLQRSVILTSAVPGLSLATELPADPAPILWAAGRELAQINQIDVHGYGWLNQLAPANGALQAEFATPDAWLQAHFAAEIQALANCAELPIQAARVLQELLAAAGERFREHDSVLAHGDFDPTHIYAEGGHYSGIIDFGEIRGAPWFYDLGHFMIENETLFPLLLAGYQELRPVDSDAIDAIWRISLLIAGRRVGRRMLQQRPGHPSDITYLIQQLPLFA